MSGWFGEAGFEEIVLDGVAALCVGVGSHRLTVEPTPFVSERAFPGSSSSFG